MMELYISDHPLDCLTCAANGDCELQDMAGVVGLRDVRYGLRRRQPPGSGVQGHLESVLHFDPSKCIVCSRCVRACEEIQGTFALTIYGRGFASKVSPSAGESLPRLRVRLLRRLRPGLPDRHADGEVGDRARDADAGRC